MGIDSLAVNVNDLTISRPTRSGPGGDVGVETVIASNIQAIFMQTNRELIVPGNREVVLTGSFFIDPIVNRRGEIVPVLVGDFVAYSDLQGQLVEEQEVLAVSPSMDCENKLDCIHLAIGTGA